MTNPTNDQIAKLPMWAKKMLHTIQAERDCAIRKLNDFCDNSKESPFYVETHLCLGEKKGPTMKRHFIQTDSITVKWRGVELDVSANDHGQHGPGIKLKWGGTSSFGINRTDVAFVPMSYQSARIVSKRDLR